MNSAVLTANLTIYAFTSGPALTVDVATSGITKLLPQLSVAYQR